MIVNTLHAVFDLMLDSLVIAATAASQFDRRFTAEIAINAPFKNKIFHFRELEIDPIHSDRS